MLYLAGFLLLFCLAVQAANCQVWLIADPQFRVGPTASYEMCVRNKSNSVVRVDVPMMREKIAGRVFLLNPGETAYQIERRSSQRILNGIQIASGVTAIGVGFARTKKNETWIAPAAGGLAAGMEVVKRAVGTAKRKDGPGDYWSEPVTLQPGESACKLGMVRKDSSYTDGSFVLELDAGLANLVPRSSPLSGQMLRHGRWEGADTGPVRVISLEEGPLPCRPSAVVEEDGVRPCSW